MVDDLLDGSENSEEVKTLSLHHLSSSRIQKTQSREWSMVVIRGVQNQNDCAVFPPIDHENLHISSEFHQCDDISASPSSSSSSSLSRSASSFSPSDNDTWSPVSPSPSDSAVQKIGGFTGWMSLGLEILRSKLLAIVASYRNYAVNNGVIWSIGPAVSAVVISWWMYMRVWWWLKERRRRPTRRENQLLNIIKEKDERIAQLLQRIVQMNEILTARYKALTAKLAE